MTAQGIEIRVAGLILKDNEILLARHKKEGQSYWVVPGGHVKPGEALSEALEREISEETGLSLSCGNLLFLNDYVRPDGTRHILNLYFEMAGTIPDDIPAYNEAHTDTKLRGTRFFPSEGLAHISIRPDIKNELTEYLETGRVKTCYLGRR